MAQKIRTTREAQLLSILINGEKYGLEIRDEYRKRTNEDLPLGSLYVTLDRMEEKGFVKTWMGESVHESGGNRRKYFKLTASGQTAIRDYEIQISQNYGAVRIPQS